MSGVTEWETPMTPWRNRLFFGDNLEILRDYIPPESVDLVYLDPPLQKIGAPPDNR